MSVADVEMNLQVKITYSNLKKESLSPFQKFVLYYITGTLLADNRLGQKTSIWIKLDESLSGLGAISIRYYGVKKSHMYNVCDNFPFKNDTIVISDLDKDEYSGVYVHKRDIVSRPVTILETSFPTLK